MNRFNERDRVLLVGLADGALTGRRLAQAEALVRERPESARAVERQRRVRRALGGVRVAPSTAPRRWTLRIVPVVAVAATLAAVLAILPGGGAITSDAAALALAPAESPAPAADGPRLKLAVDGVAFPNWTGEFGWHETGARADTLDGRATRTVFYEHMGHRIAYTIISGASVEVPGDARVVRRNGIEIALRRDGDRSVAIFERHGRTCVLAGHVEHESTLVRLAAWTGAG
jgi:hypothetical protein